MFVHVLNNILTLRTLMSHMTIQPYVVRSVFLALRSSPNSCNWPQAQAHEDD